MASVCDATREVGCFFLSFFLSFRLREATCAPQWGSVGLDASALIPRLVLRPACAFTFFVSFVHSLSWIEIEKEKEKEKEKERPTGDSPQ
jgi:hypothetical protein